MVKFRMNMAPQPQSNENDLVRMLLEYLENNQIPDAKVVLEIEHEINKLPKEDRCHVSAWLKGALGQHEESVRLFKLAVLSGDASIANNYMAYLSRSAHNYEHRVELFRIVEEYPSPHMRRIARNAAYFIGNEKLVKQYSLKMAALEDGEKREEILKEGTFMVDHILEFKDAAQLSSSELETLCDQAEAIANKRGVNCSGVNYYLGGDDDNAFIVRAQTQDAELLADMNMELLCILSDEKYCARPFTSWFQSEGKEGVYQ